jgi:Holliday junction DNA helicase RuvA
MIGRLRGLLAAKGADRVVLDVGGIGYEVAVTPTGLTELPAIGEEAVLHTHLHVREDLLQLYGFASEDERGLFRLLVGVSGVGPKLAMAILATLRPDELRRAVLTDDTASLTAVPGIGLRSAQKLMLELRPRLELPDTELAPSGTVVAEVRLALEGLGYQTSEIHAAMREVPADLSLEETLRLSLQELGKQRRA